jgi:predicted PurR-regulated permease PerM
MSAEPAPRKPLLNPSQRRIAAFSLTLTALIGSAALLVGAVFLLGRLIGFFSGVIWPLAVAGVMALILRPLVDRLERRLRLRRTGAVVLLYAAFALLVAGALVTLLPPLIDQVIAFMTYLPTLWESVSGYGEKNYPHWVEVIRHQLENPTVRKLVDTFSSEAKNLASHALPSLKAAGGGVIGVFGFITHVAIIPVYLFFFLLARGEPTKNLRRHLSFLNDSVRNDVVFLTREFISIIEAFFRGQILIGLIMGVLFAAGFTAVGLKFGLFVGLMMGILNIIPYLGTIIGLAVALPLAFFQPDGGGWQLLGLVVVVNVLVQALEGWVLTPKIMGHNTGLHPVAIIVAVFFWGTAFNGVLGMLFAIPLTAFFVTAWRLAKQKYFSASNA